MSFATVWNSVANPDRPRKLWTFYISTKYNLGLRQWDKSEKANAFWEDKPEVPVGPLNLVAPLAAFQLRDWTRCYGVTKGKKQGDTKDGYFISLLSPVWRSLSIEVSRPVLAGVSDGVDNGYLYYLSNNETIKIAEVQLLESGSGGEPTIVDEHTAFLLGTAGEAESSPTTQLAAFYNFVDESRYVVFQEAGGSLRVVIPDVQNSGITIPNTDNAKKGTPIGATSYVLSDGVAVDSIYYIRSSDGLLVKASKKTGSAWVLNGLVKGAAKPSSESRLSATSSVDSKRNVIVYTVGKAGSGDGMRYTEEAWA